jgi:transcriptional/translational regulatory protein YebC/TACO1
MSGHSKWASIKHKKAIVDSRRGAAVHEARARDHGRGARGRGRGRIECGARERGPEGQGRLDAEGQHRARDREGTGAGADADAIETVIYEAYGPGGVALLIEAYTDNRNRTGADVRHLLSKHGGEPRRAG